MYTYLAPEEGLFFIEFVMKLKRRDKKWFSVSPCETSDSKFEVIINL
jgi:hypothetical protein